MENNGFSGVYGGRYKYDIVAIQASETLPDPVAM